LTLLLVLCLRVSAGTHAISIPSSPQHRRRQPSLAANLRMPRQRTYSLHQNRGAVKEERRAVGLFNSLTPGSSKLRATTAKPPQGRFTQPPQEGFAPVARNFQLPGNEMIKL